LQGFTTRARKITFTTEVAKKLQQRLLRVTYRGANDVRLRLLKIYNGCFKIRTTEALLHILNGNCKKSTTESRACE
jgi:hypothetical protein